MLRRGKNIILKNYKIDKENNLIININMHSYNDNKNEKYNEYYSCPKPSVSSIAYINFSFNWR